MKKKTFLFTFLMTALLSLTAIRVYSTPVEIDFQINFEDPKEDQDNPQRGPVLVPNVSLDGHTLYLYNVGYDLTLVLLDEDGEVAYTVYVPAGTSAMMLPATLCGDYEIQLYPDGSSYYFYGWVEL